MSEALPPELRHMVREVIAEVVTELRLSNTRPDNMQAPAPRTGAEPKVKAEQGRPGTFAEEVGAAPSGPRRASGRRRVEDVRIADDRDLMAFVQRLLRGFANPKTREDIRAGRLTYRLVNAASGARTTKAAVTRFDSGAVTERQVAEVAAAGGRIVLGPAAVVTPLAREKASSLKVPIDKERR